MNLFEKFGQGLPYADFLARHANDGRRSAGGKCTSRWR